MQPRNRLKSVFWSLSAQPSPAQLTISPVVPHPYPQQLIFSSLPFLSHPIGHCQTNKTPVSTQQQQQQLFPPASRTISNARHHLLTTTLTPTQRTQDKKTTKLSKRRPKNCHCPPPSPAGVALRPLFPEPARCPFWKVASNCSGWLVGWLVAPSKVTTTFPPPGLCPRPGLCGPIIRSSTPISIFIFFLSLLFFLLAIMAWRGPPPLLAPNC